MPTLHYPITAEWNRDNPLRTTLTIGAFIAVVEPHPNNPDTWTWTITAVGAPNANLVNPHRTPNFRDRNIAEADAIDGLEGLLANHGGPAHYTDRGAFYNDVRPGDLLIDACGWIGLVTPNYTHINAYDKPEYVIAYLGQTTLEPCTAPEDNEPNYTIGSIDLPARILRRGVPITGYISNALKELHK